HHLQLDVARGIGSGNRRKRLAGDLLPAHAEVLGDVRDGRSLDARGCVVPADGAAGRVLADVEAVALLPSEVDAADEGNAIVDHDRLLMVAVQGPLFRVDAALDPSLLRKLVAHPR